MMILLESTKCATISEYLPSRHKLQIKNCETRAHSDCYLIEAGKQAAASDRVEQQRDTLCLTQFQRFSSQWPEFEVV